MKWDDPISKIIPNGKLNVFLFTYNFIFNSIVAIRNTFMQMSNGKFQLKLKCEMNRLNKL